MSPPPAGTISGPTRASLLCTLRPPGLEAVPGLGSGLAELEGLLVRGLKRL